MFSLREVLQLFGMAQAYFHSKQRSDCRPDTYIHIIPAQAVEVMLIPKLVTQASALASPVTGLLLILGTDTAGQPGLPHPGAVGCSLQAKAKKNLSMLKLPHRSGGRLPRAQFQRQTSHCSKKEKGSSPFLSLLSHWQDLAISPLSLYMWRTIHLFHWFFFQPSELTWHMEDCTTHQCQHRVRNGRAKAGRETSLPFGWPSTWQSSWHSSLTLCKTIAVSPKSRLLPFTSFFNFLMHFTSSSDLNPAGKIIYRSAVPIYQLGLF